MQLDNLTIYVLKPKDATNLVLNPSFEQTLTGYTTVSSSSARTTNYQRRGRYSLEITPTTGVSSGVYYGTVSMASGTSYSFSADVLGIAGQTYRVQIRSTGGTVLAETSFTGVGYWQRKSVTYLETSSTTRRLYIVRDAVASTSLFYVDGLQCEVGNESTYIDGDMKGYLRTRNDYGWNGAPHTSTSWRSITSRHGGEYVNITSIASLLLIVGLGMAPVKVVDQAVTTGGSLYQKSTMQARDFTLSLLLYGNKFSDLQASRKALIDAIRPDGSIVSQPLTMIIQGTDPNGLENMERCVIPCVYMGGLEASIEKQNQEIVNLQFRQFMPLIQADGQQYTNLSVNSTFTANGIIKRDHNGTWSSWPSTTGIAVDMVYNPVDGRIYMGGGGSTWGGVTCEAIIAYDPSTNAFSALGTGTNAGATIYKLAVDAAGNVYAIGNFTSMNSVVNSKNIARWNISAGTWTGLNSGLAGGLTPALTYVSAGPDGNIYVAGTFATINGVSAQGIARWTGIAWSSIGSYSHAGTVDTINVARSGKIYITHHDTSWKFAEMYDGTSWNNLDWYGQIDSTYYPSVAMIDSQDRLWGGGASAVAYWNGSSWVNQNLSTGTGIIKGIYNDPFDHVWILASYLRSPSGILIPNKMAEMIGPGTLIPPDASLPLGGDPPYCILVMPNGDLYISGNISGPATVGSVVTNSNSTALSFPIIKIIGPGNVYSLRNYTTGKMINFNGIVLVSGETLEVGLQPDKKIYAKTNLKGNIIGYFNSGTDFDFPIVPGTNYLSMFMTNTTGGVSGAYLLYSQCFWSLDGATR